MGEGSVSMVPVGLSLQPCATPHRGDLMIVSAGIVSSSVRDLTPDDIGRFCRPCHSTFQRPCVVIGPSKPCANKQQAVTGHLTLAIG